MSFGMTYSPKVPGGGAASYKLRPVFTYNNGYLEKYSVFRAFFFFLVLRVGASLRRVGLRGGSYVGGSFLGEICHGGTEIQ